MNYKSQGANAVSSEAQAVHHVKAAEPRTPEVAQAILSLGDNIVRVHGLLSTLLDRLEPVLRNEPAPETGYVKAREFSANLANAIQERADSAQSAGDTIDAILARLEL